MVKNGKWLVLMGLVLLVSSGLGYAQPWYVDDDNCPGPGTGTAADPFCTIQAAVNFAVAGHVINVAGGTYTENVTVPQGMNGLQILGSGLN